MFCKECGSEEHPYSYSRCARCYVRKLLTEILSGMARGQLPISYDPFREQIPMDRRHNYLRDLLTSTAVLPPYTPAIERIPWLADLVAEHPTAHAEVLNRFTRWHVLRRLRQHAARATYPDLLDRQWRPLADPLSEQQDSTSPKGTWSATWLHIPARDPRADHS